MFIQQSAVSDHPRNVWPSLFGGALALFVAMGVSRFAYTPILPLMQEETHFSSAMAGYLASSNYLGYLFGAFVAGFVSWLHRHRQFAFRCSLCLCIATTGCMAVTSQTWLWLIVRLLSGLSSAVVFVMVSSIVMDELARHNRQALSGVVYGGVGLGIAVTGALVPAINHAFAWQGTWLGMMVLSICLGIPAMECIRVPRTAANGQPTEAISHAVANKRLFSWLIVAYGCEGLGYIITATFLVDMASSQPALHKFAPYLWVVAGMAAMPSCLFGSMLARRFGDVQILVVAYLLQAVGVLLPVVTPNAFAGCAGAILFGGTFMGITASWISIGSTMSTYKSFDSKIK
ncbi:YbfB/YjiJ family MFS transporter [Alicyclobacillus suci]|uniref:YbfB/YjiJ family MFS transporter n=1 Tax=Alicyclobacillus suci TaxID=2816080 RepID=UPI001A9082F8|nr:YbfB/YjiJ family MFS transporter [Alicyclobacillus suci]